MTNLSLRPSAVGMRAWRARNPGADKIRTKEYVAANPRKRLIWSARERAKARGLTCTITEADIAIPEYCPVFGILLVRDGPRTDATPSLDRIDNTKGYVKGNVIVVSWRANRLKADATPNELTELAKFYNRETM